MTELLHRRGFASPPPESVAAGELRGRLWELLYALAGIGHYFCATNHLSDAELYAWLHGEWLRSEVGEGEPTGPVPVADPVRCPELWLRYHASEEERALWSRNFPDDSLPARLTASQDRDRWLPQPRQGWGEPGPEPESWLDEEPEVTTAGDPLGLGAIDQEIRRDSTEDSAEESDNHSGDLSHCNPESWERPLDELIRHGVRIMPPDEITEEALSACAWELIHELACRGFYLLHTDHLTDRELYTALWREGLRQPAILPGRSCHGGWYHDFAETGLGTDNSADVWLKYYATEKERAQWMESDPTMTRLPDSEIPAHRRDWRLPQGPL